MASFSSNLIILSNPYKLHAMNYKMKDPQSEKGRNGGWGVRSRIFS